MQNQLLYISNLHRTYLFLQKANGCFNICHGGWLQKGKSSGEGEREKREKEGRLKSYSQHSFMYIMPSLPSDAAKAQGSDLQHEGVKGYPLDLRGGVCIEGIIVRLCIHSEAHPRPRASCSPLSLLGTSPADPELLKPPHLRLAIITHFLHLLKQELSCGCRVTVSCVILQVFPPGFTS